MTYDEKQLAAVLVTCQGCGKSHYMTVPEPCCLACREALRHLTGLAVLAGLVFSASELLERAGVDDTVRRALGGARTPRQVGHRLHALAALEGAGVRLVRLHRDVNGFLWTVALHDGAGVEAGAGV